MAVFFQLCFMLKCQCFIRINYNKVDCNIHKLEIKDKMSMWFSKWLIGHTNTSPSPNKYSKGRRLRARDRLKGKFWYFSTWRVSRKCSHCDSMAHVNFASFPL